MVLVGRRDLAALGLDPTGGDDLNPATEVRPVGVDRYGLTVQCTLPAGAAGLGRLTFPVPRDTVADAVEAIHSLLDHHEHCQTR